MDAYYKVVKRDLTSAIQSEEKSVLAVQYIQDVWVKSKLKQAPLMVFGAYHEAKNFAINNVGSGPHRIFECRIKRSKRKWGWIYSCDIKRLYSAIKNKKGWTHLVVEDGLPTGTILADEVMLVREIV